LIHHAANFFLKNPGTDERLPRLLTPEAVREASGVLDLFQTHRFVLVPSMTPAMGVVYPEAALVVDSVLQDLRRQQQEQQQQSGSARGRVSLPGMPYLLPSGTPFALGVHEVTLLKPPVPPPAASLTAEQVRGVVASSYEWA
jgi:hypothetical protein